MATLPLMPDGDDRQSPCRLLVDTAGGDREAYATLFGQIAPKVLGLCQRILGDSARSEKVAQEVLIEVWRSASCFDPDKGCALPWILTIAHRQSVDCTRSVQATRDRDERAARGDGDHACAVVSEAAETRQQHERVRDVLEHLPPVQREVIDLAYFGGHTHREVAELLDVPPGTVATRIRDGLTCLGDLTDQPRTASHASVTLP